MVKEKISVSQLVDYLKRKNDNDPNLFNVAISGELSNVKIYPSNHMYFDIKDERSKINAIMFKNDVNRLQFKPQDGDKVTIIGNVKVYQKNSNFQLITSEIILDGYGQLFAQFEKNKKLLAAQGLFDAQHKRAISNTPNKIAIISGQDSAALKDVLRTLNMRYKLAQIVVFPTLVQGESAPTHIINNIKLINRHEFDVILLVRGGGSFEDLNAFNDVALAQTIYDSRIPIVTGVGHESDFTIADLVSDYRGATPTAAAIKVSIDSQDFLNYIASLQGKIKWLLQRKLHILKTQIRNYARASYLNNFTLLTLNKAQQLDYNFLALRAALNQKVHTDKKRLADAKEALETKNIHDKIIQYQQALVTNRLKLDNIYRYNLSTLLNKITQKSYTVNGVYYSYLKNKRYQLNELNVKLQLLDPSIILAKGYSIVKHKNRVVKDYNKLRVEDEIEVIGNNGSITAIINEVKINE